MGKKNIFTGYTLYLIALLVVAVVYLAAFFPKQKQEMDALDLEYQTVQAQVQALAPYEAKLAELKQQTDEANVQFDADRTLKEPVQFANALCNAATSTGVTVQSITVTETGEVPIEGGFTGKAYTAEMNVGLLPGTTPAKFLSTLESNSGAGFYVQGFDFSPTQRTPEQGPDPYAQAMEEAAAAKAAQDKAAAKKAENSEYNAKRVQAEKAAQNARVKAALAAATNNPADVVDAQIAADLASKLAAELADLAAVGGNGRVETDAKGAVVLKNTAGQESDTELDTFALTITYYTMEK